MPLKKRSRVSNNCKQRCNTARKRIKRSNESEEQREQRLERKRTDTAAIRSNESEEQRERRLETKRTATAASRSKKLDDLTRIAFNYQASTVNYDHPSLRINSMMKVCTFCKAKKFQDETLGICCSGGKVLLEPFHAPPPLLQELFSGETPTGKQFLANIMEYKGCFSMTSFGHQDASVHGWNPSFRIQGQVIDN